MTRYSCYFVQVLLACWTFQSQRANSFSTLQSCSRPASKRNAQQHAARISHARDSVSPSQRSNLFSTQKSDRQFLNRRPATDANSALERVHRREPLLCKGPLLHQQKRRRQIKQISVSLFSVLALFTRRASAATTTSLSRISILKSWMRPVITVLLWATLFRALLKLRLVRRRQALDATSEWSRYALYPASRGRAIMALCFRLLGYWFLVRIAELKSPNRCTSIRETMGRTFATGLLQLGPLYIKLGQIVSCRENLLPTEWMTAMEQLQDRVPAKSGEAALELAHSAMGSTEAFDHMVSDFDTTPIAAASLGQVHRAILRHTNETVAIKLQRPFLRAIYDQDLTLLLKIANMTDTMMGKRAKLGGVHQSWTEIFMDARDILYREIDYRDEAENAIRFATDFGLGKGGTAIEPNAKSWGNETLPSAAEWLRTPYVYDELSSEQVLVMEYVPSIKITNTEKLNAANLTAEDKEFLADSLARAYLRQFCANKFFSTDPHPGNLGVDMVQGKPRLVFYDFGQACELQSDQADGILDVIEAIVDMDASRCVDAFSKMGVLVDNADLDKVRAKVQNNFDTGKVQVKRKKLKKAGYALKDLPLVTNSSSHNSTKPKDSEVMSFFTLPAEYAFVARALSQMHGVGKSLDPDFDFISSAAPHIVEIKGASLYIKDEWSKWARGMEKKLTGWQKVTFRM